MNKRLNALLDDYDHCKLSAEGFVQAIRAVAAQAHADILAVRRERDDAIEGKELAELELAYLANEMVYEGNSIGWIASKAANYGKALHDAWAAVTEVGGVCDGSTPLHQAIRKQLIASTRTPVVYSGDLSSYKIMPGFITPETVSTLQKAIGHTGSNPEPQP